MANEMNDVELLDLIVAGESETVEFKREMDRPERLAREFVALANRQGGTVLIGVDDDHTIYGVTLSPGYDEWIANVGAQAIYPPLLLTCETKTMPEDKTILVVYVPSGPYKPHYVREGGHRRAYIRHGTTSHPASYEEIGSLYQQSGVIEFDLSPIPNATLADLSMDLIEEYTRSKLGIGLDKLPVSLTQQLINWKILVEQKGERKVTFSGMLFFCTQPGNWMPQARLWLKRFKGLTTAADEWYPGKEIDAPIPQAIEQAIEYVKSYTVVEKIVGLKRVQQTEYIEAVVREALVNAIAHRNYMRRGSRIHVFIFDDHIEIRNPGPLPNGVTLEKMRFGIQATRNPTIVRYLKAFGYWEGDGLGIPRMIRLCRENNIREPDFTQVGDDIIAIIYSRLYDEFHKGASDGNG